MEKTFKDFLIDVKDKNIVCFGAGEYLAIAQKLLCKHDLSISYTVDNDFWKNGTNVNGIEVCTVDRLIHDERNKTCVLICDLDIYNIAEQLKEVGIYDFYALPLFAEKWYKFQNSFIMGIPFSNRTLPQWGQQCHITIANACNLSCPFCAFAENPSIGEHMPYDKFLLIAEQLETLRIKGRKIDTIRLGGNKEGLLHPNFSDMVSCLDVEGFKTRLVTNGVLMTSKTAKALVEHCCHVRISITGITNEVYHHFQGSKRANSNVIFNTVVNNVVELVKLRNSLNSSCYIDVGFICTELSAHQIGDAIHFWKKKGVDRIMFFHESSEIIIPLKNADTNDIDYTNTNGAKDVCFYTTTIAANGDVYPCCTPDGEYMPIGNCFEAPLNKIFNSNKFYSFIKDLTSLDPTLLPHNCKRCSVIAYRKNV